MTFWWQYKIPMDIITDAKKARKSEHFEKATHVSEKQTKTPRVGNLKRNLFHRSNNHSSEPTRMPTSDLETKIKTARTKIQRMGLKTSKHQPEHTYCETHTSRIKCRCTWVKHISKLHKWAQRAQNEGAFCDFSIKAGSVTFRAHSIIVACHSGLFRRVAKSNQNRSPHVCIRVENIRPEVVGKLLDYAYTGKIELTKNNVAEISKAAIDFEMAGILRICLDFVSNMDAELALLILLTEGIPKSNLIFRRAFDYTLSNFRSLYSNPLFNNLGINLILSIVRSDDLVVYSEMEVLDALLKWTHHNFEERKCQFKELIHHVRFCQMEMDELIWASSISDLLPKYCHKLLIHANWLVTMRHLGYRDPLHLDAGKPRNCLYYRQGKTKENGKKK